MPTEKAAAEKKAAAFTKENLLSSRRFQNNRDALAVCLTDGFFRTLLRGSGPDGRRDSPFFTSDFCYSEQGGVELW